MLRLFGVLLAAVVLWAPVGAQAAPDGYRDYSSNPYDNSYRSTFYGNKKYYGYSGNKKSYQDNSYGKKKYKKSSSKYSKKVRSGGARPYIVPKKPGIVKFRRGYKAGSIVIDTAGRRLYYVVSKSKAYSYPIAVGKPGFAWTGTKRISAKKDWPDWRPPKEMRQRTPGLPELMKGGVNNPLGAKALYLGSSLYRIHGTNNVKSIGTASSSGCFRMSNGHVAHLSRIAKVGTTVHVVRSLKSGGKKKRYYSKRYRKNKSG